MVVHGLDELILTTRLLRPVRFIWFFSPGFWLPKQHQPRGVRVRRSLEDLGPIFVKFGQMLSTRRDLTPEDIADELALLQDRVPPFAGKVARVIVERELGQPIEQMFSKFESEPLASASIAQVHAAELHDGRQVIVKVLRPGIKQCIEGDIALLRELANP